MFENKHAANWWFFEKTKNEEKTLGRRGCEEFE
jgi:hypothetical protein